MEYTLIKSKRRTVSLEIQADGSLIVRAPKRLSKKEADSFVKSHEKWIDAHRQKLIKKQEKLSSVTPLTKEEIKELREKAKELIPKRTEFYASLIGVKYNKIALKFLTSRWGSCSGKGNLNFNILLMLSPIEVIDSVVVHELCHLRQLNHSPAFYAEVLKVCPDYYTHNKWLKENGGAILESYKKYKEAENNNSQDL